jgi:hypothetical protein
MERLLLAACGAQHKLKKLKVFVSTVARDARALHYPAANLSGDASHRAAGCLFSLL